MRASILTFTVLSVLAGSGLAAPVGGDSAGLAARDGFVGVETTQHPDKRTATHESTVQTPGSENSDQREPPSQPKPVQDIGSKGRWQDFIDSVNKYRAEKGA